MVEFVNFNAQDIANEYGIAVDEVRSRRLMLHAAQWKADFKKFAHDIVKIRTKKGELKPLILNPSQLLLHDAAEKMLDEEKWVRLAALKGRRQGFSTYVAARGYWRSTLWKRQKIYILSHEMTSSNVLFQMVNLIQEQHPFAPAVGTDNAKEIEFKVSGSSYTVATAGQKAGGRGGGVSFFHGSEVAWWTNAPDHFSASVQSVDEVKGRRGVLWERPVDPLPFEQEAPERIEGWVQAPSEIWLETTSAGPVGEFYTRYMDAVKEEGRYRAIFAPWTDHPDYNEEGAFVAKQEADEGEMTEREYQELHKLSDSQMLWRRSKAHELGSLGKFRQEYPLDVTEAFLSAETDGIFIHPSIILRARKQNYAIPDAPLIIGVDPAGAGGDRFAVVWRRGDKVFRYRTRNKLEHDEAVAWLSGIIDEWHPAKMCIDRGSMGNNIISSLRALGPKYADVIKGVDFGGTSKAKKANPKRAGPFNMRAEIWGRLREWLVDGGDIPDDTDLASDLSAPKIMYRANNDWLLESKKTMKDRGIRSPDLGDALALTFTVTEYFESWSKPEKTLGWGGNVSSMTNENNNSAYSSSSWMG